jgi:hypothetical protein
MATDATLDHLERDEALDIGAELGKNASRSCCRATGRASSASAFGKIHAPGVKTK